MGSHFQPSFFCYRPSLLQLDADNYEIITPENIFLTVGVASSIFFSNTIKEAATSGLAQWGVSGAAGSHLSEKWSFTPADTTKNETSLTIGTNNLSGKKISDKTVTLKVAAAAAHGNINLLWIGDSTSPATLMGYLAAYDTADANIGLTFIGTQNSPNFNESWPGKTVNWIYSDASSPFVKSGAFNFAQYLTDNSLDTPDLMVIQLGINDVFGTTTDSGALTVAANNIAIFESMLSQFRAKNTGVKVFINLVSMPSDQDKFGADYGNMQLWKYKRRAQLYNKALLSHAWPHYVTVLGSMLNINPATGMANGVHPNSTGYQLMADAAYAAIKNKIPTQIAYHDSKYNSGTRLTTTDSFSLSGANLTTTKQSTSFDGASATFSISKKTSYRIRVNATKGSNTTSTWNVGILLWDGSTAVSYDLPSGSQGIFNQFIGNLNYVTYSAGIPSAVIDTTINLSSAPNFTHMSLHFSGYSSGGAATGEFVVVDLSSIKIEAL